MIPSTKKKGFPVKVSKTFYPSSSFHYLWGPRNIFALQFICKATSKIIEKAEEYWAKDPILLAS